MNQQPNIDQRRKRAKTQVTIHEVAALAGLSIKTVSRVINREPNVKEETARRVQKAIDQLNYRPNLSARNLAGRRAFLVVLVYDNPSDAYVVALQQGALDVCREQGYSLVLHPTSIASPALIDDLLTLVRDRNPTGLVLTPPVCDVPGVIEALSKEGIDYTTVSPSDEHCGCAAITIDGCQAGFELTEYLISLGHRRIGFIKGPPTHRDAAKRYEGYNAALREHGIKFDRTLVARGLFSFESGRRGARTLLSKGERPTAIFAANDDMAAGVLYEAHQMGLRVPEELSVAGFDDSPLAQRVWPSLTTVRQPISKMAELAVIELINSARHDATTARSPRILAVDFELVVRQSTSTPATSAPATSAPAK